MLNNEKIRGPSLQLWGALITKNLVRCGKAFGPSGFGQITWDFQTGTLGMIL